MHLALVSQFVFVLKMKARFFYPFVLHESSVVNELTFKFLSFNMYRLHPLQQRSSDRRTF